MVLDENRAELKYEMFESDTKALVFGNSSCRAFIVSG
jgi:hypothetical protein